MRIVTLILILFLVHQPRGFAQLKPDSVIVHQSKPLTSIPDSSNQHMPLRVQSYQSAFNKLLAQNRFISVKQQPVLFINKKREAQGKEYIFFLLGSIVLTFGFFRVFYGRYFHNIFRVFFNTSLRQNQLTDLLLQARLPSLIFNIFFTVSGGLYLWLLIPHYYPANKNYNTNILFYCIAAIGVIYIVRFCVLKFIGWITGLHAALNTYIFVIFLINKIVGIALIPLILILAFASPAFFNGIIILSLVSISIFFLIRFFRSYSLLQQQLNISRLHFLLYIISLEILPLLVIYKLSITLILKI